MATFTSNLKFIKPGAGENVGTWGTTLNTKVTDLVDEAVAGVVAVSISGNHTLAITDGVSTDGRHFAVQFTGTLSGTAQITLPATQKVYIIHNNTTDAGSSGPYALTIKTPSDSGISLPNGKAGLFFSTGSAVSEAITNVTGNATFGGTADVTGNFNINTNKFQVTAASGNTTIAGTLGVTSTITTTNANISAGTAKLIGGNFEASPSLLPSDAVETSTGAISAGDMAGYAGRRLIYTGGGAKTINLPTTGSTVSVGDRWTIINAQATHSITLATDTDDKIDLALGTSYSAGSAGTDRTIGPGGLAEISVLTIATNVITYVVFGAGIS